MGMGRRVSNVGLDAVADDLEQAGLPPPGGED
jgi:hypothetical protein